MEKETAEIAQISFYLGKDKHTFASILDPEAKIESKTAYRTNDFNVGDAVCRFIYFETTLPKSNPPWLDFANEKLPADSKIQFSSMSHNANGILLVSISGRILAATFGRSASGCLASNALEPDFGIKTAMNMCGNEEIRQTKSQSNTITLTHIDRQVSKPSDTFAFGLSEAEDLKYISAHMKGENNITLQGRDSLTMKVIGEKKLNWDDLITRCKTFLTEFGSKTYTTLFPNYKNFRAATDVESAALDAELISALQVGSFERIRLSIPEFVSEDEYSYTFSNHRKKENFIYAFLDSHQLSSAMKLASITIHALKAKKIYAYSAVEDKILSYKKWYVYNCLSFEHKLGQQYFILTDGRWLEVDPAFYDSIESFIAKTLRVEPCEARYKGIDISDHAAKKNKESVFNAEVCKRRNSNVLFDLAKLKIGQAKADKEFCDILDLQDDGTMRIINCKPYKDASSINYLFSQSQFYCQAFLQDDVFLSEIRRHVRESKSPKKKDYLAYIAETTEELDGQKYRLCLWLLYDQSGKAPKKGEIPLIAKYELKLMHDHLRKVCKMREIVMRFIPVQMTNYKTAYKQKKAA